MQFQRQKFTRKPYKLALLDVIFIFWLKWLHLRQFAYGDYESEIAFFLSR